MIQEVEITPEIGDLADQLIRFQKLMPNSLDPELLLLKSHLLIEEALVSLIHSNCKSPSAITDARLSFHQSIHIARALVLSKDQWLWRCLESLNKARNTLAHRLSPEQIHLKMDDFVAVFKSNVPDDEQLCKSTREKGYTDFHLGVFILFSVLSAYARIPEDPEKSSNEI